MENADEMAETWTIKYKEIQLKYIPIRTVKITPNDAPWITVQSKKSLKHRNQLYKVDRNANTDNAWRRYRDKRNLVIEEICEAKRKYTLKYQDRINTAVTRDDKLWWKLVKNVLYQQKGSYPSMETGNKCAMTPRQSGSVFIL